MPTWSERTRRKARPVTVLRLAYSSFVWSAFIERFHRGDAGLVHRYLPAATVLRLFEQDALAPKRDLRPFETVLFALTHSGIEPDIQLGHVLRTALRDGVTKSQF